VTDPRPDTLPEGFPGDYRIRPAHYVQLDVGAATRNLINIWLPETVRCDGRSVLFLPQDVRTLTYVRTPGHGVRVSGEEPGMVGWSGTVEDCPFGVAIELEIANLSGRPLAGVGASPCFQLAAAPDFRDFALERTLYRSSGRWAKLPSSTAAPLARTRFSQPDEPQDLPLIVVDSSTGPHALGLIFRSGQGIGVNCQASFGCLHSSPPSADLGPGQTWRAAGRLFIHPQGKDALLGLAEEFAAG